MFALRLASSHVGMHYMYIQKMTVGSNCSIPAVRPWLPVRALDSCRNLARIYRFMELPISFDQLIEGESTISPAGIG